MNPIKFSLHNGVRVLVEPIPGFQSTAVGLWCQTGSKHEFENEAGITHFIEHMLFKGTPSRNAKQIAEEIEGRGGILNAFTDKEQTCYYARVLSRDTKTAVEVLSDMMTNSLLDPEELNREKGVVIEEISRSEDEPGDHVHDLHIQERWKGHVLGKPIIGTKESVASFNRDQLVNYMDRRYRGTRVVLSVSGNVDPDEFRDWAEAALTPIQPGDDAPKFPKLQGTGGVNYHAKDVEQVHFCIGTDGCSAYDDELYVQAVLDGALGSGMSSRLFQEVRERRGLAYAIGSYSLTYADGGAFTIYGGTGKNTWEQVQEVVSQELEKVRRGDITEDELMRVKRSMSGHLVLALESMSARMSRMTKNELIYGRAIPIEETLAKIESVTRQQLNDYANRIFDPAMISTTVIGPA